MRDSTAPIVVLRDAQIRSGYNSFDAVLSWTASVFPNFHQDFRVLELPDTVTDWRGIRLLLNWTLDPVRLWSNQAYQQILALQEACDQRGIPVINRVERQELAGKFQAAQLIARAGLRTPRMVPVLNASQFLDDFSGLRFPFMLRENWGHQGEMVRVNSKADIKESVLKEFINPVAIEIIDVRNPQDGWYRMRRYLSCGAFGVSLFTLRARDWIVRDGNADRSADAQAEFSDYAEQEDSHHEKFQAVARMLGMDILAFDYALDHEGQPVVWEVNPYTRLRFASQESATRITPAQRAAAAMVSLCRMRAGLPVNEKMLKYLGYAADQVQSQSRSPD